jgi:hypothetical protein
MTGTRAEAFLNSTRLGQNFRSLLVIAGLAANFRQAAQVCLPGNP